MRKLAEKPVQSIHIYKHCIKNNEKKREIPERTECTLKTFFVVNIPLLILASKNISHPKKFSFPVEY